MWAVKGNRGYTIAENEKNAYVKDGFDIYKDGKKIATGKGKTVAYEEHEAALKELNALKEEHEAALKELNALKEKPKASKKDAKDGE